MSQSPDSDGRRYTGLVRSKRIVAALFGQSGALKMRRRFALCRLVGCASAGGLVGEVVLLGVGLVGAGADGGAVATDFCGVSGDRAGSWLRCLVPR